MQWQTHYTGIEIAQSARGVLYLQRDRNSKQLRFARFAPWRGLMIGWKRGSIHFDFRGGFEVFTANLHVGYLTKPPSNMFEVRWSGSSRCPYRAYSIRLGRLFIGSSAEMWLQRWKSRRENARQEVLVNSLASDLDRRYR